MTARRESTPKKTVGHKRDVSPKKDPSAKKHDSVHKSRLHEAFQEEIANTYFRTQTPAKKTSKKKKISKIPWLIAVVAVVVASAIFISKSNFDIKVKLVNGTPFITRDGSALPMEGAQFLIRGGEPNNELVARAYFLGDARSSSQMSDAEVSLSNSRGQGWASFVVEFKDPVDLNKFDIRYLAKGASGAEKIVPIIFDSENRSYRIDDASVTTLAGSWQAYIINFKPVKGAINLSKIASVKFEFGTETAGNGTSAVMSIKDISIAKTRRIKWL